jgi:hypothetical protein
MTAAPPRRPAASLVVFCMLAAIGACDSPTRPTPVARPPFVPPAVTPGPANLAGSYALTIDIPDACDAVPAGQRRRQYAATLATTAYAYLSVYLVGGGYADRTVVGDIWYSGQSPATIDWNNFDIGGCDGWLEDLPGGDTLMICGNGPAVVDEHSIVATMSASAIVDSGGRRTSCSHDFLFTFLRR